MSEATELIELPPRPRGLVPGTREWLAESEGPRIIKRLVDEVMAGGEDSIGKMTPTQARCASMLLDRYMPTLQSHHHTIEDQLSRKSTEELKAELRKILTEDAQDVTPKSESTDA